MGNFATSIPTPPQVIQQYMHVNKVNCNGFCSKSGVIKIALTTLLLLGVSADVDASRRPYRPSVGICGAAAKGKSAQVADILLKDPSAVQATDGGATPLHWAARFGHEDIVRSLLQAGALADARASDGGTPLHWAASRGQTAVVTLLLPRYTDVDVRDNQLETPLYRNCQSITRHEIARKLVDRGADPNVQNAAGTTALQNLAFHGEIETLKILVESGADINARGFRGATALHWAVDGRRLEIVRFLLDHGADVSARDEDNRTPLDWCVAESKAPSFGVARRLKRIETLLQCNK